RGLGCAGHRGCPRASRPWTDADSGTETAVGTLWAGATQGAQRNGGVCTDCCEGRTQNGEEHRGSERAVERKRQREWRTDHDARPELLDERLKRDPDRTVSRSAG